MSGLDKILEHISREAREEADQILTSAKEAAQKILISGKKEAEDMAEAIRHQSELDVAAASDRIVSNADLNEKRIILQAKQDKIEEVFDNALKYLEDLDDASYMEMIGKMISRYASGREGTISFNQRDLSRLSEPVKALAEKQHLQISAEPVNICGGFILSYGDIEENCSFDVLIGTSREELQDKVGQLLFGQQG